ncbi:MAG TPA: DUF4239 domain-containing protein, partial [Gemmataceae bacterium]|nr:DUF4239 domain-containing protein [Gemmataceae bacterium]
SSFDNQRNGLSHMAGDLIFLDRVLAHYGPETKEIREQLRASVADMLQRTWPNEGLELGRHRTMAHTEGKYEGIYEKIQELSPKNDAQRSLQAQALKTASDIAQSRWELFAQKGSSIPLAFLVVLIAWVTLILGSFSLFAPPKPIVVATLLICALTVSSAVFLILELDRPFDGLIQVPSAPLKSALAQLENNRN